MKTPKFKKADRVIKLGSDYTAGRIGIICQEPVQEMKKGIWTGSYRYRVTWVLTKQGGLMNKKNPENGLRTWVTEISLAISPVNSLSQATL